MIKRNLPINDYHKMDGLSKTMMDKISISPAYFKWSTEHETERTTAMVLGALIHTLVLNPETFDSEYAIAPECDMRTKIGKEIFAGFTENNIGKIIIHNDDFKFAETIRNELFQNEIARKYLTGEGENEISVFWNKENILCKARFDRLTSDGVIVDLKTATSGQIVDFQNKAVDFGYHKQAYWFTEAYKAEFGKEPKGFLFIVIEKTEPYQIAAYLASPEFIELGRIETEKDFNTYKKCLKTGIWYGLNGENNVILELGIPNYKKYILEGGE